MARKSVGLTVQVELNEVGRSGKRRIYGLWIPGFGNPGCTVTARNGREAEKLVSGFIGNELMNAETLGEGE